MRRATQRPGGSATCFLLASALTLGAAATAGGLLASVSPDAPKAERDESDVLASLACEAGRAYASKDMVTLERITADDYVQTDVRGAVLKRAAWLDFVRHRTTRMSIECEDVVVRRYGEVAVVTGGSTYTARANDKEVVMRSRWTSVWTRDAGAWKRHVLQNTYVNAKADRCAMGLPH